MFSPVIFEALAMAIAAFVLPFDVIGTWEIECYDKATAQFEQWCEQHPEADVTPLILGFFMDDEIEIEDFDLGEPGPREGDVPEPLDDEIALLIDKMNEAAQECDYPAWYEASQAWNEVMCG